MTHAAFPQAAALTPKTTDLPGVSKENVHATVKDGMLMITAERNAAPDGFKYVRKERGSTKMTRQLR